MWDAKYFKTLSEKEMNVEIPDFIASAKTMKTHELHATSKDDEDTCFHNYEKRNFFIL